MSYSESSTIITINNEGSAANPVTLDDIVANSTATKIGQRAYNIPKDLNITNNSYVAFENATVTINCGNKKTNLVLSTTSTLRVGQIDANGNTYNGCNLNIESVGGSGTAELFSSSGNSGNFFAYASRITSVPRTSGVEFIFWRLYRGTAHQVDIIDCIIEGYSGTGRLQGLKWKNSLITNCQLGSVIPITTASPSRGIDGLKVIRSRNFFYYHGGISGSIVIRNLFERDNGGRFWWTNRSNTDAVFINPDLDPAFPSIQFPNDSPNSNNRIFIKYSLEATVVRNADNTNFQGVRMAIYDIDGGLEYNQLSDANGKFSEALLNKDIYTSSNPTNKTPHLLRMRVLGFTYIEQPVNASSASKPGFRLNINSKLVSPQAYSGVAFNYTTRILTLTENRTTQQVYDANQFDLQLSANMDKPNELDLSGGIFILNGWKVDVTNTNINNSNWNGEVLQATPQDVTNLKINGTLRYNTNADVEITFDNSQVTNVINDGTGTITIFTTNGTNINNSSANVVPNVPPVTATLELNNLIVGSRVIVYDSEGIRSGDWEASTAYAVGDRINPPPTSGKQTDNVTFLVTTAGTTSATRPSFPEVVGQTVTDGTVTFEAVSVALVNDTATSSTYTFNKVLLNGNEDITVAVYYVDGLTAATPFIQASTLQEGTIGINVSQPDYAAYRNGGVDGSIGSRY